MKLVHLVGFIIKKYFADCQIFALTFDSVYARQQKRFWYFADSCDSEKLMEQDLGILVNLCDGNGCGWL